MSTTELKRMTLGSVTKGRVQKPHRIVLYGVEGVGKTTFAASAPNAIILPTEDGSSQLEVARFPLAQSLADIEDAISELRSQAHDYRTLVLDTLDFAEPLIWRFCCQRDSKKDIEDYGYGKGYVAALDVWRTILAQLEALQATTAMNVILVAHSWIKSFKNPEGGDFDRYQLKLHDRAAGLLKEWAETVLFANYETFAEKDQKTKRVKGVSTGSRLIYTQRTAAYDAKNRMNLPESMPLSWQDYADACERQQPADPSILLLEIERKAAEVGGDVVGKVALAVNAAQGNAAQLAKINDRLNALLAQKGE